MNIYVASHCRWAGLHVASVLRAAGHNITSRWLNSEFKPTDHHSAEERRVIAQEDFDDVVAADGLVLVAGPDRYPGGKFVEAGIALARGLRVVIIGRRENMLMWMPCIESVDTPEEASALYRKMQEDYDLDCEGAR